MTDLAGRDQILHRARDVFDGNVRIDAVLIVEVDHLDAETLERFIGDLPDMFGAAVEALLLAVDDIETELGRDHDLVADRRQRLAHDFFVRVRSIDFRRVEERHATLMRGTDQGYGILPVESGSITEIEPHAAEAEGRDFKAAFAEFALLHSITPWIRAALPVWERTRDRPGPPIWVGIEFNFVL